MAKDLSEVTKMRTVIGIDIGGSATKIVAIRTNDDGKNTLVAPMFVQAADALTSAYLKAK